MKHIYISFLLALPLVCFSQYQTDSITSLKNPLSKSSGLIYLNGSFITHSDDGNAAALYEIDTVTGLPNRTVYISNATNVDWEDIAADFNHIYIGDFGNNQGTRQDLKIYKIAQSDYFAGDTVQAEIINFSYANQATFTPMPFATNFDAEALTTFNDSLYIFTKQWGAPGGCRIYGLPKTPGTYSLPVHDSLAFPGGIVTAADMIHDALVDALVLMINDTQPRMHARYNIVNSKFSTGTNAEISLIFQGSLQVGGLATLGRNLYYFTSETLQGQPGMMSALRKNPLFNLPEFELQAVDIYPNPTKGKFTIEFNEQCSGTLSIFDLTGQLITNIAFSEVDSIDYSLPKEKGTYVVTCTFEDGTSWSKNVIRQ